MKSTCFYILTSLFSLAVAKNIRASNNIDNITTFAKISSYVRHFYPNQNIDNVSWESFNANAINDIKNLNSKDFPQKLRSIFKIIAPDLKINDHFCDEKFNLTDSKLYQIISQNGYSEKPLSYNDVYYRNFTTIEKSKIQLTHYNKIINNLTIELPLAIPAPQQSLLTYAFPEKTDDKLKNIDRETICQTSAIKVWGILRHFHPHIKIFNIAWEEELPKLLLSCNNKNNEAFFHQLRLSLSLLQDNHISFTDDLPQYTIPLGFELIEDQVILSYIEPELQTIAKIGDRLEFIDGEDISKHLSQLNKYSMAAKNQQKRISIRRDLLRKEKYEKIILKLRNQNNKTYELTLDIKEDKNRIGAMVRQIYEVLPKPLFKELDNKILYINLSNLKSTDLETAVSLASKSKGIILDLRTYPAEFFAWYKFIGEFSKYNFDSLPLFFYKPQSPNQENSIIERVPQTIPASSKLAHIPTVALSSAYSISQNEHALGFAQSAKITIIGEQTYGINGNAATIQFEIKDETNKITTNRFQFTGMEVRQHDMSQLIGIGIKPDISVTKTIKGLKTGEDEILETAIKHLNSKIK